ncbi:MAG: transcription termination/antitermination protein NusA [Cyanobacteria bacterium HKST-UBA04]|nr:transcription termination/antitermination protein NusA [Cyanobacteria bacterium HKST-UBA04]
MIKLGVQLQEAAEQLEREKGIPRMVVMDSVKEAMMAAYRRYAKIVDPEDNLIVHLYEDQGEIGVFKNKKVVEAVSDPEEEISLHDAMEIDASSGIGDELEVDITPNDFGRIAAQTAKQVLTQRIREAEKKLVYNEFEERKDMVSPAIVQRLEGRNVVVSIGRVEAIMPPREQLPGEYYRPGAKIRVYISGIRDNGRVPQIIVSQAHPEMVREVFELEVPEIEDGLVELKTIAREAGYRTKVAVHSPSDEVDPQGACIGTRGSRIQAIVNELKNEKIDIIRWSDEPKTFITNALAPAKIVNVEIIREDEHARVAQVTVPDDQLSLAIGRDGQNVRLAAKLTGWKLDIKSVSQIHQMMEEANEPHGYGAPDGDDAEAQAAAVQQQEEEALIEQLEELDEELLSAHDEPADDHGQEDSADETAEEAQPLPVEAVEDESPADEAEEEPSAELADDAEPDDVVEEAESEEVEADTEADTDTEVDADVPLLEEEEETV